ncbi:cytochrome-c oxidase, cbb3-type subunit III [Methylophaga sp. 41_12_T18]|nr:cytochrome-c oxidase, cbb3-type subunit III [Methylophaga sp. 41_12_T18]
MAENKSNPNEVSDTGHEWDGIKELDNPCPRWWLNSLYLSGLIVVVYFVLYPSLPLVNDSTKGLLGWTQIKEYKEDLAKVEAKRAPFENQLAVMTVEEILADQKMLNYSIGSSKVLYGDNCAACHGMGGNPAAGSGYPILADDDWLYGGSIYDIEMSIANGRIGMMPAHSALLNTEEVDQLVQFVVDSSNGVSNEAGLALYNTKGCVACHGADAKGVQAMGSANLTDKIWRFSGDEEQIRHTILHGVNAVADAETRVAVMPQWSEKLAIMLEARAYAIEEGEDPNDIDWDDELEGDEAERLTETEIKKLAVYVHQFGGGQ